MNERFIMDRALSLKGSEQFQTVKKRGEDAIQKGPGMLTPGKPLPPKGTLYSNQVRTYFSVATHGMVDIPETARELADKGDYDYRQIAAHIVDKEGLADLSPKDLDEKLRSAEFQGNTILNKGSAAAQEIYNKEHGAKDLDQPKMVAGNEPLQQKPEGSLLAQ